MHTKSEIEFHIENLKVLIAAVKAEPELNVNLNSFRVEEPCGTLYCTAGIMTNTEHFVKLGMFWETPDNAPMMKLPVGRLGMYEAAERLFGKYDARGLSVSAFQTLFEAMGMGYWDRELGSLEGDAPAEEHKSLALARLRSALAIRTFQLGESA